MNKFLILLIFFTALGFTNINSQDYLDEPQVAVRKGDVLLTGFASYPNWPRYAADVVLGNSNVEEYEVGGIAPLGLKFEYMLSNQFGFTIDGIYNSWSAKWVSNSDIPPKSVAIQRYRIQIGVNYHMDDLGSTDLDLYGGFGIGSNSRSVDRPDFIEFSEILSLINNPLLRVPISFRLRLGGRYFLTENVAINFELGSGGPFLSGGLTFLLN